jgi:hypothetical protein
VGARPRLLDAGRRVGYDYVHCAVDDHTRLAYAEIHPDEKGETWNALSVITRSIRLMPWAANQAAARVRNPAPARPGPAGPARCSDHGPC